MSIITLTSDWGTSDFYLAAVKGTILSSLPEVTIVDVSHHIRSFDLESAAFTLRNCFRSFPRGTVHIVAINTEESINHPHVVMKFEGHYFIGADNGVFSMIFGDAQPEEVVEINVLQDSGYFTFSTRDRFAKVAVLLLKNTPLAELGVPRQSITRKFLFEPVVSGNVIRGQVTHIDAYENAITNISSQLFKREQRNRKFEIYFAGYRITKIDKGYQDVGVADLVAIFGTHGMLEIAINQGKAASLCGLERTTQVTVTFN
ncbi:MAG TPA: SAM-dependent chlorinase/fluorinase [Bacteroidales bacterium]|nr:SAM-dependent chlorinase/fluorinase [Bacteroidales bacterium]